MINVKISEGFLIDLVENHVSEDIYVLFWHSTCPDPKYFIGIVMIVEQGVTIDGDTFI